MNPRLYCWAGQADLGLPKQHHPNKRKWTATASLTREVPKSASPAAQLQVEVLQVHQGSQVGKASGTYLVAALHAQMLQLQHACTAVATGVTVSYEWCVQKLLFWLLFLRCGLPGDIRPDTASAVAAAGSAQILSS